MLHFSISLQIISTYFLFFFLHYYQSFISFFKAFILYNPKLKNGYWPWCCCWSCICGPVWLAASTDTFWFPGAFSSTCWTVLVMTSRTISVFNSCFNYQSKQQLYIKITACIKRLDKATKINNRINTTSYWNQTVNIGIC